VAAHLKRDWPTVRALDGSYHPQSVRREEIPKSSGLRPLGIPTARPCASACLRLSRLIQQVVMKVLQSPSPHSDSFRLADLEKYSDPVNHHHFAELRRRGIGADLAVQTPPVDTWPAPVYSHRGKVHGRSG
jgi:retron-type reverse transcriptase